MEREVKQLLDTVTEMKNHSDEQIESLGKRVEMLSGVVVKIDDKNQEMFEDLASIQQKGVSAPTNTARKTFNLDIKGFTQSGEKDFEKYHGESKGVNTGGSSAGVLVPEVISNLVIESAIENQVILGDINFMTANTSDFKIPYIENRPAFLETRGENVTDSLTPLNDGQAYGEYSSKQKKFTSSVFFSDEIMQYGVDNTEARFLKLLGEDFSGNLIEQYLHGDGGTLNFRGVLNSRIDKANTFVEALKDDATRGREFYGAIASGTAGELGADNASKINNLVDLQTELPSKYQPMAKFYMSRTVFADIRKMIGTDGHPVFGNLIDNGADGQWFLLGKPVVLVDHMSAIGEEDALIMYGALGEASALVKQFDKVINDPYTRPDGSTITFSSVDSEIMGAFDAVKMLVAIV